MSVPAKHNLKWRSAMLLSVCFIVLVTNKMVYADNDQWVSKVPDQRFSTNPEHGTNQATLNHASDDFGGPDRLRMLDDILINATAALPSEYGDLVALKDKITGEPVIAATNHYSAAMVSQVGDSQRRLTFLDPYGDFNSAFVGTSNLWGGALTGASPLTHFSGGTSKVYIGLQSGFPSPGGIQIGSRYGEPGLLWPCGGSCNIYDVVVRPEVFLNNQLIRPAQLWFISGGTLSGLYRLTLDSNGLPLEGAQPELVFAHPQDNSGNYFASLAIDWSGDTIFVSYLNQLSFLNNTKISKIFFPDFTSDVATMSDFVTSVQGVSRIAFQEGTDFDYSEVGDSVVPGTDVLAVAANYYEDPYDYDSAIPVMNYYDVQTGELLRAKTYLVDEYGNTIPIDLSGRNQAVVGSPTYFVNGFSGGSPSGGGGPIPGFSPEAIPEIPRNFFAVVALLSVYCLLKLRRHYSAS